MNKGDFRGPAISRKHDPLVVPRVLEKVGMGIEFQIEVVRGGIKNLGEFHPPTWVELNV